eukprot:1149747-Pelagomonas_calceolata.AAC.2
MVTLLQGRHSSHSPTRTLILLLCRELDVFDGRALDEWISASDQTVGSAIKRHMRGLEQGQTAFICQQALLIGIFLGGDWLLSQGF